MASHPLANDSTHNNTSLKLAILIQGVKDEKQKNFILQNEIISLKEELHTQKQIVNELQRKIDQLSNNKGKKQITTFFNQFFEGEEDEKENNQIKEDQIKSLEKEINELKEQITSIQKEKSFINGKLKEQIAQFEVIQQKSANEINEVHKHYQEQDLFIKEQSLRINSMTEIIKRLQREKIEYEHLLDLNKKDQNNKDTEMGLFIKEKVKLREEIELLQKRISELNDENTYLKIKVEELTKINKKTVFQGMRILNQNPKKTIGIKFTFGQIENNLVITEDENQKGKVIDLKYILSIKKIEENKLEIITKIDNYQENYLVEINSRYIKYILRFFNQLTNKDKKEEETINDVLIRYFVGKSYH